MLNDVDLWPPLYMGGQAHLYTLTMGEGGREEEDEKEDEEKGKGA